MQGTERGSSKESMHSDGQTWTPRPNSTRCHCVYRTRCFRTVFSLHEGVLVMFVSFTVCLVVLETRLKR